LIRTIVNPTCRSVRTKRIKEARDEAKKEIEAYKAEKEQEYKKFEAEVRHERLAAEGDLTGF
jgi:V-type H+-transporting ATPase subunit G